MHADHYFTTSQKSDHFVCQDYADSDSFTKKIFLSDGCSNASKSDFGARLLVQHAKNLFPDSFSENDFLQPLLKLCIKSLKLLDLTIDATLPATLLTARVFENQIHSVMVGDGVSYHINKDDSLHLTIIEYDNNAPYYLAYLSDLDWKERYVNLYSLKKTVRKVIIDPIGQVISDVVIADQEDDWHREILDLQELKIYGFLSDGASSFYNSITGKKMETVALLQRMLDFKSYAGEFVARRMISFLKDCKRTNIMYQDDLSMTAIYFGD